MTKFFLSAHFLKGITCLLLLRSSSLVSSQKMQALPRNLSGPSGPGGPSGGGPTGPGGPSDPSTSASFKPSRKPTSRSTNGPDSRSSQPSGGNQTRKPTTAKVTTSMPSKSPSTYTYGELSNFDCYCVTGEDCHGFEIELENMTCTDVWYTFQANRYGMPEKEDTNSSCIVRYRARYNNSTGTYSATTRVPLVIRNNSGTIQPTGGHSCFVGGMPTQQIYDDSGCEHFGVSLAAGKSPLSTSYRWLIADPVSPGALLRAGTKVGIPPVSWSVNPVVGVNGGPLVQAHVEVEDFEDEVRPCEMFGDAKWVKVYVTEVETEIELEHLVGNNPVVPQTDSETEIEWQLVQRQPTCGDDAQDAEANDFELEQEKGDDSKTVIRRYEFYEYVGAFDPENHEARPVKDRRLAAVDVGNYLGSQMAAVVFDPIPPDGIIRSSKPTKRPSRKPTKKPVTRKPSKKPTARPSRKPTKRPTSAPTKRKSTSRPSKKPTRKPSRKPTKKPTRRPTKKPTRRPTKKPTRRPTLKPTRRPTKKPTRRPTKKPTRKPSRKPTKKPTRKPTRKPSTRLM